MTWVRIDDHATTHPKLRDAGAEAAWLWVCGLAWCNGKHTDGVIRKADVGALYHHARDWSDAKAEVAAGRLVEVRLWHDEGDSWRIHDYAVYQEEATRNVVEERREYERTRKARQRAAARGVPPKVPGTCPGTGPGDAGAGHVPPSVPVVVPAATAPRLVVPDPRPTDRPTDRPSLASERDEDARLFQTPDGRWALWQRWKARASRPDDAPIHADGVARAWQAAERKIAPTAGEHPALVFERLAWAYLTRADDAPIGKKALPEDRRATVFAATIFDLASEVYAASARANETARLRAEARAQREARA